jgi:hypothetical protein
MEKFTSLTWEKEIYYSSTIAKKSELEKITDSLPYLVHRIYKRIYFIGSCSDLIAEIVPIEARWTYRKKVSQDLQTWNRKECDAGISVE